MNECFFCGQTERPLTEEHVWPVWVSRLLRGKYGSDHFVHIRSTGNETTGLWKAPVLKVTTKSVCDKCNNDWLSAFENDDIKPIASPLILGEPIDIMRVRGFGRGKRSRISSERAKRVSPRERNGESGAP